MLRARWRRFRPRLKRGAGGGQLAAYSVFSGAHQEVSAILSELRRIHPKKLHASELEPRVQYWCEQAARSNLAQDWLVALILQAPRAVLAQIAMDKHPHGYRHRHDRLFELIDFNDAYNSTVLAFAETELIGFNERLKGEIDWLCKKVHTPAFSDRQFEAITHGLSREIAVFKGAQAAGYTVRMTNRRDDAFGVDMVITDPVSGAVRAIDCKTSSSYFLRLQELMREGRLSAAEETLAETRGFVTVINRGGGRQVAVTIVRIDSNLLGPITHFRFERLAPFAALLEAMFKH